MRPSQLFACPVENDFQSWLARFASVEELFSSRDQLYAKLHKSQIDGAIEEHVTIEGPVHIGPGSYVRSGAVLIGPLVIGPNCNVDHGARVFGRTFIGAGTRLRAGALVADSIAMNNCTLSEGSIVQNAVLGSGVIVQAGCLLGERADSTEARAAFIGDGSRLGLGAVICSGTIVLPRTEIPAGSIVRAS